MKGIVRANCHGYGPAWRGVAWRGGSETRSANPLKTPESAPFGSRPALLSGRRAPLRQGGRCAPAGLRRTPPGFGLTLGSDGEGQGLRLLRPCRPERLHRAG
ncbi:hypothetical protein SS45_21110 [Enterobacter hormaechei subsp. steigerwaltii]|nr:hypothetical protein SS45_21110 [Enterobacter hormaechei subsp. steigerwaltii]